MSMYALLLRHALHEHASPDEADAPVCELVRRLRARRRAIGAEGGSAHEARLVDWIAHDALLVQICLRRGIEEHLTDPTAGPVESERARLLAAVAAVHN